jgi:hypothetical protein
VLTQSLPRILYIVDEEVFKDGDGAEDGIWVGILGTWDIVLGKMISFGYFLSFHDRL